MMTPSAPTQTNEPAPAPATNKAMVLGTDSYRGALEPNDLAQALDLARMLAPTLAADAGVVLGKIMYGRALGIPALQSIQTVHDIEGKKAVDAAMLMALCLKSPICEYFEPVIAESDNTKATFIAKRKGRPEQKFTYTLDDAEQAGLLNRGDNDEKKKKANWQAHRRRMLEARAKATLSKLVFPDVTQGLYSKEELESMRDDEEDMVGEIVANPKTPPAIQIQVASRDFARESDAFKQKILAASSRASFQEVREQLAKWDAVDPYKSDVEAFYSKTYSDRQKEAKARAAAEKPAPATGTADQPSPLGSESLFEKKEDAQ